MLRKRCHQLEGDSLCRPTGRQTTRRVPQPPIAWSGARDASQFGPACMQADDLPKSEDCLFLNVWRHSTSALVIASWQRVPRWGAGTRDSDRSLLHQVGTRHRANRCHGKVVKTDVGR
jgi:Carboxylesterase family